VTSSPVGIAAAGAATVYNDNFYRNGFGGAVMVVVVMMVVFPMRAMVGGRSTTTGCLIHLVFGQILQRRLVKRWFLRKHSYFPLLLLKLLSSHPL
jgi:hypothetical protein